MIVAVIHNPERQERCESFLRECIEQGIEDFVLFPAIFEDLAQTGISKAHKAIIRWAKENGIKEVVVFEDDIKFTAKGAYKYFIENKPEQYEIYFGGISGGIVDEINRTVHSFSGMFCYAVSELFYDVFLEADEGTHIDRWLSGFNNKISKLTNKTIVQMLGRMPVYKMCCPMIAETYNGYSDQFKREMVYDQFFAPFRKYKNSEIGV